jgi:acyl dehydratase
MPFDFERLMAWEIPDRVQAYEARDTILYALGLGFGDDPTDPRQLRYVYEDGLQSFPTFGNVVAFPGFWLRDPATGADWVRIVHGEEHLTVPRRLPPVATVVGRTRVIRIIDKGPGRGAIVVTERLVTDASTGEALCTVRQSIFCRGDGGCGGPGGELPARPKAPDREPDHVVALATLPQAALIYRLSGDLNPLHADPAVARAAGFERPILHGLATFGMAARALTSLLPADAEIGEFGARFTSVVLPGDVLETCIWREPDGSFLLQARVGERVVLDDGHVRLLAGQERPAYPTR